MTRNTIAGCTFVMNKELAKLISDAGKPDHILIQHRMHDAWIMLVAIVCGHVLYDETSHMLYRIHEDNAVGIRDVSLCEKIGRLKSLLSKKNPHIRMNTAKELLRLYPIINGHDRSILEQFANYQNSMANKIQLIFNREITLGCEEKPLIFKIKVLLGYV